MLSPSEIEKLLKKKEILVAYKELMEKITESWDLKNLEVSPQLIATVWCYLKHKYKDGETLNEIESSLGIAHGSISRAIRELEFYGYITVSRSSKPFRYMVVK